MVASKKARETEVCFKVRKGMKKNLEMFFSEHESVSSDNDTKTGNCEDTGTDDRNGAQSETSDSE
jgi:hypothetical protein